MFKETLSWCFFESYCPPPASPHPGGVKELMISQTGLKGAGFCVLHAHTLRTHYTHTHTHSLPGLCPPPSLPPFPCEAGSLLCKPTAPARSQARLQLRAEGQGGGGALFV